MLPDLHFKNQNSQQKCESSILSHETHRFAGALCILSQLDLYGYVQMKVTMVEGSPGESLEKCKADGDTSAGVLDLNTAASTVISSVLQRNTGRALIKVSALITLPLGILDQAFNICLDLVMIPGCCWPSAFA